MVPISVVFVTLIFPDGKISPQTAHPSADIPQREDGA
jgi:hypothetical protein